MRVIQSLLFLIQFHQVKLTLQQLLTTIILNSIQMIGINSKTMISLLFWPMEIWTALHTLSSWL